MGKDKTKKEKTIEVIIKYPDHRVNFVFPANCTGKEVLVKACTHVSIYEFWWFQLFTEDADKNPYSLREEKKLSQQNLQMTTKNTYSFQFLVKFYPIDVMSETIQTQTWKMIYRDLRSKVMSEELYCDPTSIVTLAALHLQYSIGFSSTDGNDNSIQIIKDQVNQLVPKGVMDRHSMTSEEWANLISDMWKSYRKLTQTEALKDVFSIIQETDMYGVRYFDIKNKNGSKLFLGVDCDGLNIYKANNKLLPEVGLSWSEIKSVEYVSNKFIIKPLDKNSPEFVVYSTNVHYNQYMMRMIIGNHEMYLSRRSPTTSEEVTEYKKKAKSAQVAEEQKMAEEVAARQRAIALEAKVDAIEQQVIDGGKTDDLIDELKTSYDKELDELNKRMAQLQNEAEDERKKNNLTEEEIRRMKQKQFEVEQQMEEERKAKEELLLKETQALNLAAEKAAEAERVRAELEALKLKYEKDQELIKQLASKAAAGEAISKRQKSDVDTKETQKTTESMLSERTKAQAECDIKYEEVKKIGRTKHQTLKIIRSGNTAARIDKFEAL